MKSPDMRAGLTSAIADQAAQFQPHLVGLSCLLTSSHDAMRATVALLHGQDCAGPIAIGGGQLSEQVCQYVGADHRSTDAASGVDLCQRLIASQVAQEPG